MTAALKLSPSPKAVAGALFGVLILLVVAAWFVAISPKRSKIDSLNGQISSAQTELSLRTSQRTSPTVKTSQLKPLRKAMPDAIAMPEVIDQLHKLATGADVTLDTITPTAAVIASGYDLVPMTLVVDGHFFAVQHFLRSVRTQVSLKHKLVHAQGRLFDVQAVNLQETEPAPNVTATLTVNAFVYTGTSPAPTTPTDTTTTTTSGSS